MDLTTLFSNLFLPGVSVAEKIIRALLVYLFLVIILRVGGRRELAQMNAFDLVVLLTISNTVQNAIIGNDDSLFGGIIGATTLVLANLVVVRFLYRHPALDRKIEGEPVWLVRNGGIIEEHLRREMITEDELLAAVRRQGVPSIEDCDQVILETSGTITVIPRRPTAVEASTAAIETRLERIEKLLTGGTGQSTGRE
ncbi:MAG: DUF421 domain-containing protein [Armatimonadota bacterium]|nr:DUF421 domain-containing protein [Armatimonadota bacterium]